ncbi:MAG: hypothetical protein OHK0023_07850 [Anaerolineae bacterium]
MNNDLLGAIFEPHNRQYVIWSNLVSLINTLIGDYNIRAEQFIIGILSCINFLLLAASVWLGFNKPRPRWWMLILIPCAFTVFSWRFLDTWTHAIQTSAHFALLFMLLGILLLQRLQIGWRLLLALIVLSFAAALSHGSGLPTWGAFAIGLWLRGERNAGRWIVYCTAMGIMAWLVLSAQGLMSLGQSPTRLSCTLNAAYLNFPDANTLGDEITSMLARCFGDQDRRFQMDWGTQLSYFPMLIGGAHVNFNRAEIPLAQAIGSGALGLFLINLVLLRRWGYSWRDLAIWIALSAFAMANAVLLALVRGLLFQAIPEYPLIWRYSIHFMPFWVALFGTCALVLQQGRPTIVHRTVQVLAMCALLAAIGLQVRLAAAIGPYVDESRRNESCPYAYLLSQSSECFYTLAPPPDRFLARYRTDQLFELGLGMFGRSKMDVQTVSLRDIPIAWIGQIPQGATRFSRWGINGTVYRIFSAPDNSIFTQTFTLRADLADQYVLRGAIYVDPSCLTQAPSGLEFDGSLFQLTVADNQGTHLKIFEGIFDPTTAREPIDFSYDITELLSRTIVLTYETRIRQTSYCDWAMWVHPRLELLRSR